MPDQTVETTQVAYGPCDCGLVHGSWQECPDGGNSAVRILRVRELVERVSARGNVIDPLDAADLAAVLMLCTAPRAP